MKNKQEIGQSSQKLISGSRESRVYVMSLKKETLREALRKKGSINCSNETCLFVEVAGVCTKKRLGRERLYDAMQAKRGIDGQIKNPLLSRGGRCFEH